jgi:hypothetical protein
MLGKKGPRSAPPPVSQVTLTTGLPNWQDGEHKDLSSRVLVVREMTTKMTCSAAIPQGMTDRQGNASGLCLNARIRRIRDEAPHHF